MEFKLEWFEEAAELADLFEELESLRPYSGRGMYGKECPAMTVAGDSAVCRLSAAMGLVQAQHEEADEDAPDAIEFAGLARTDSMGRGSIVVYWEGLELDAWPDQVAD